jgi:hypothetical protein
MTELSLLLAANFTQHGFGLLKSWISCSCGLKPCANKLGAKKTPTTRAKMNLSLKGHLVKMFNGSHLFISRKIALNSVVYEYSKDVPKLGGLQMLEGQCHCGKVKWSYPLALESVTACNCNLCRRYGALWAYGHIEDGIKVSGPTKAYSYAKKHNGFHFCAECGGITYYLSNSLDSEGKRRCAVNLRMITDFSKIAQLPIDHFDGFDKFEDEPRDGRTVKDLWY